MRKQSTTPFYYEIQALYNEGKNKKEAREIAAKTLGLSTELFNDVWHKVQRNDLQTKWKRGAMVEAVAQRLKNQKKELEKREKRILALYPTNLKISEIAAELGLTASTVSGTVDSMIRRGLLVRRTRRYDCGPKDPKKEQIKTLLLKGESFGRVVKLINDPKITRNVVCGIYTRHIKEIQPRDSCVRAKDRANQGGIASVVDSGKNRISTGIPLKKLDNPSHDWSLKRSDLYCNNGPYLLENIPNGCCHYPVGDTRPIQFCGLPRDGNRNYCPEHAACVADKSPEAMQLVERTSVAPVEKRILSKPR